MLVGKLFLLAVLILSIISVSITLFFDDSADPAELGCNVVGVVVIVFFVLTYLYFF